MQRIAILLALSLLATPVLAAWRDIPYDDMARIPLLLQKLDQEGIYRSWLEARPGAGHDGLPADLRVELQVDGRTIPVPCRADGTLDLPWRADWSGKDAKVRLNYPKDRAGIVFHVKPRTPPGTRMSYAKLTESLPLMERGIREMAGMMSFLAPEPEALALQFASAGAQTLVLTRPGRAPRTFRSSADGKLELPWEPDWNAATVVLSAPLQSVDPVID